MNNEICGVLKYKKKFYFTFNKESNILIIQPAKMEKIISMFSEYEFEKYPYLKNTINLSGETNDNRYIEFFRLNFKSIGRGCFQAWVPGYILGKANAIYPIEKPNNIKTMYFYGEPVDLFVQSKRIVKDDWDDGKKSLQLNVDYGNDKIQKINCGKFELEVYPSWKMPGLKELNNVLEMYSVIKLTNSKKMDLDAMIDNYLLIEKLLCISNYRQHVIFNKILLSQKNKIQYEEEISEETLEFEMIINNPDYMKFDLPNNNNVIVIEDIIERIPQLIKNINDDKFIVLSLPYETREKNIVDNDKFISVSSSFESEFELLFPGRKSLNNKDFNSAKSMVINSINSMIENKECNYKTREYLKDLKFLIEKEEGRLEEKIKYAFERYEYIIEADIKYLKKNHKDINAKNLSKAFSKKRNELSHGSRLEQFDDLEVISYTLLRKINYAMLLERAGIKKEKIKFIINKLI